MNNNQFKVGQKINYTNGSECIYSGYIAHITTNKTLVIVEESAEIELCKKFMFGTEITFNQVKP